MQITRRADYAVRTMLDLASLRDGEIALTHEVADRQSIPRPFLAKIVLSLTRAGLLRSHRGAGGGIALGKPIEEIDLLQIVEAVDGPVTMNSCVIWPDECGRVGECPVHEVWCKARDTLVEQLSAVTLASLANGHREQRTPG